MHSVFGGVHQGGGGGLQGLLLDRCHLLLKVVDTLNVCVCGGGIRMECYRDSRTLLPVLDN